MTQIKTSSYKALSLILALFSTGSIALGAPTLMGFTFQFTRSSTLVPISVNYGGNQIITTPHETAMPRITFEIPKGSEQNHFDVLITSATIEFQLKELPDHMDVQNTVDYLKIDPQASYKYYSLDLVDNAWDIKEEQLPKTGQIPDRCIIIECYPEWIKDFKGGSAVEFPTLYLNNAVEDLGATQEDFEEALIKLELTALDSKIVHSPLRRKTQTVFDKKRVLIMDLLV